jgi:hypothetical protein
VWELVGEMFLEVKELDRDEFDNRLLELFDVLSKRASQNLYGGRRESYPS